MFKKNKTQERKISEKKKRYFLKGFFKGIRKGEKKNENKYLEGQRNMKNEMGIRKRKTTREFFFKWKERGKCPQNEEK